MKNIIYIYLYSHIQTTHTHTTQGMDYHPLEFVELYNSTKTNDAIHQFVYMNTNPNHTVKQHKFVSLEQHLTFYFHLSIDHPLPDQFEGFVL